MNKNDYLKDILGYLNYLIRLKQLEERLAIRFLQGNDLYDFLRQYDALEMTGEDKRYLNELDGMISKQNYYIDKFMVEKKTLLKLKELENANIGKFKFVEDYLFELNKNEIKKERDGSYNIKNYGLFICLNESKFNRIFNRMRDAIINPCYFTSFNIKDDENIEILVEQLISEDVYKYQFHYVNSEDKIYHSNKIKIDDIINFDSINSNWSVEFKLYNPKREEEKRKQQEKKNKQRGNAYTDLTKADYEKQTI